MRYHGSKEKKKDLWRKPQQKRTLQSFAELEKHRLIKKKIRWNETEVQESNEWYQEAGKLSQLQQAKEKIKNLSPWLPLKGIIMWQKWNRHKSVNLQKWGMNSVWSMRVLLQEWIKDLEQQLSEVQQQIEQEEIIKTRDAKSSLYNAKIRFCVYSALKHQYPVDHAAVAVKFSVETLLGKD